MPTRLSSSTGWKERTTPLIPHRHLQKLIFLEYLCGRIMAREKIFRFKQFDVLNDRTAMKVGTDGVLLGAWCAVDGAHRVLDVGTGCGVIALMIAQRNSRACITGIDIDHDAVEEAAINFANSPWSDRLTAHDCDFNELQEQAGRYDLIVSNPPYFIDSMLAASESRTMARHNQTLNYQQLIEKASRLLIDGGSLAFISPTEAESLVVEAATFASLPVRRVTRVMAKAGAPPKRLLWLLSRQEMAHATDSLTIADGNGHYTDEYVALTQAFYLKM